MGIVLEPPDVNRSVFAFTVGGEGRISYGLGALKGVGQSAVEAIVTERDARGRYKSLFDREFYRLESQANLSYRKRVSHTRPG
jgi:DNA polymerase-3 subunit alpha